MSATVECYDSDKHKSAAVGVLFELFAPKVLGAAYHVVRDRALAEDVMQDTFITALDRLDQLKDSNKVGAWLTRIAINKAYTELRRNKKVVPISEFAATESDAAEILLLKEEREHLHRAFDRLQPDYQSVLYLKYGREMRVKEIAQVLKIPEGTVKSRLRRARDLVGTEYLRNAGISGP